MPRQVLLFRSGALGDTLLTLGALDALRRRFPGAAITLAARPAYAAPLLDAGRADAVLDAGSPPFHLLYTQPDPEGDDLTRLLASFEAIVLFTRDTEIAIGRSLSFPAGGCTFISRPFPPEGKNVHAAKWMLSSLARLDISAESFLPPPKLVPSAKSAGEAASLLAEMGLGDRPFLALHPGSGGAAKCAPPGALARIARAYCDRSGARLLLIAGPADGEAVTGFREAWGKEAPAARTERLEALAALLARAAAFLGCDSGVSHLAALCGTPTLALFGPASDPGRWAPIGARAGWMGWEQAEKGAERLAELVSRPEGG
ncbi:MAG: glycosyltransferase family 9 protein [bacterium]